MAERELRYLEATEVRAIGGNGVPRQLTGYAAVFNRSAKLPNFEERIQPGAFTRSITQDIVGLWNHNSDIVLGRTTAGTLHLEQDARGLKYTIDLPDTEAARGYHESVRRGDVTGSSFGFMVDNDGQAWSEGRHDDGSYFVQRDLTNITRLTDVSPVTYPAYDDTQVFARSMEPPAELRSAVAEKNAALQVVVSPANIGKEKTMPELRAVTGIDGYNIKPQDCPESWPEATKIAYCNGYNEAFAAAVAAGHKFGNVVIDKAISGGLFAIHELNKGAEPGTEQPPAAQADTDLDEDAKRTAALPIEKRDDDSIEDFLATLNKALEMKFPSPTADGTSIPGLLYWIVETFQDHVIVCKAGFGNAEYSAISYNEDDDGNITFGDPTPVDKVWVPSERALAFLVELRAEVRDAIDETDEDDGLDDSFDMFLLGRSHDEDDLRAGHVDGDCEMGDCSCQNRWCPSGSAMRSELPPGVTFRFEGLQNTELRSGMTRTKRVGGKDLGVSSFAYVGDADKTETWKFPIFDAAHVRNALARWGQAKGIPDDKKDAVLAKINAAAKRFGVTATDDGARAAEDSTKELRERLAEHMTRVGPDFQVSFNDESIFPSDVRYSPDQPRDDHGRFGEGTSASAKAKKDEAWHKKGLAISKENASRDTAIAAQHTAAAAEHTATANKENAAGNPKAAEQHLATAAAHEKAAELHLAAAAEAKQTGAYDKGYEKYMQLGDKAFAASETAHGMSVVLNAGGKLSKALVNMHKP